MEIDDDEDHPPRKTLTPNVPNILELADGSDYDSMPPLEDRDDEDDEDDEDEDEEPEESDEAELGSSFYNYTKITCLPDCRETLEGLDFTRVHFLQAYPSHRVHQRAPGPCF